jgi:DNA-binding response OmpR family regulator
VLTKKRVLIVEDHHDSRRALTLLLRKKGFDVKDYEHCDPADRHVSDCDMDIALLDVRLPGRCGDDFGRELREKCPQTMIVFITGEALLQPLKEKVPDCFVMRKPVDIDLLLELLECFNSKTGYHSKMETVMDGKAGPGNM